MKTKWKTNIDHGVECFHFQKKKKNDIKVKMSQVVLYVYQWSCFKQKYDDLRSNWLDVYFNLTKGMTGFLLSNQFWNIKLDSKSYSLENQ